MYKPMTDQEWQAIEPLFPKPAKRGRGKPHASWRCVVNSILLVFLTKEKWSAIPVTSDFATKSVSHRWFAIWDKSGFLNDILKAYKAACQGHAEMAAPPRRKRVPKSSKVNYTLEVDEDLMEQMPPFAISQEERQTVNV